LINSAYTAFNGIKVARTQIEVSMNNVANESTPGYKRRTVVSEEIGLMGSPQGHGSQVGSIVRAVDERLQENILKTTGKFNYLDSQESIYADMDDLSSSSMGQDVLRDVTNSFVSLQNTPEDAASRNTLRGKVNTFVYSSNNFMAAIDNANHDAAVGAKTSAEEINIITKKIARINESIGINKEQSLDLLDKRDELEKELSKYVDFTIDSDSSIYTLTLNGSDTNGNMAPIISGTQVKELSIDISTETHNYINSKYTDEPKYAYRYLDTNGDPTTTDTGTANPNYIDPNDKTYNYTMEVATLKMADTEISLTQSRKGKLLAQLDLTKDMVPGIDATATEAAIPPKYNGLEQGKLMMISFLANIKDDIQLKKNDNNEGMQIYTMDFTDPNNTGIYLTTSGINEFNKTDKTMVDDIVDNVFNKSAESIYGLENNPMTPDKQENYIRDVLHSNYTTITQMKDVEESMVDMYQSNYDELSKVDSNDEMIKVMQYQASYQAGAKMVQVIDEMIQTLLGMKR
jgi:flagellar hook-associated protein 1 FlgK